MVQEDMACPMAKGERILVAVDSSKYSDIVVEQAISMGRVCNSVIFAISVIELYAESIAIAPEVEEKMAQEVRATLETIKRRFNINVSPLEVLGRVAARLGSCYS